MYSKIEWTQVADQKMGRARSRVVKRALEFAREKLDSCWRSSSDEEAIDHAKRVAFSLQRWFGAHDSTLIAIALLHDVLEDTMTTVDEIREEFGDRIADGVLLLTKPRLGNKAERLAYQRVLADAGNDVRLVKLADYLDNLATRKSDSRRKTTAKHAMRFVNELRKRQPPRRVCEAMEILSRSVRDAV